MPKEKGNKKRKSVEKVSSAKDTLVAFDVLQKDLKKAATMLTLNEARFLVDLYYTIQKYRIRTNNQLRGGKKAEAFESEAAEAEDNESFALPAGEDGKPNALIAFFGRNYETTEHDIKVVLEKYAKSKPICRWMMSITGIGPIIAAGLYAHIDIKKANSAGAICKFAGVAPGFDKLVKGQKSPFNKSLKTLVWKIGESFLKQSGRESDVYGHILLARREYETAKNENGEYADEAAADLKGKNIKSAELKKSLEAGKLTAGHILQRSKRYAAKMFLSHLFIAWKTLDTGEKPAAPYPLAILGHKDEILVPNWEIIEDELRKENKK